MNNNKKLFETNHHFHEYELGNIHDIVSGIISIASKIISEYEIKDPNFKNYKYCIINKDSDIKIPNFLKDKTEVVEKSKKFLWWTTKKWTETIEKKSILDISSHFLTDYEINSNWLEKIETITIIVPLNVKYIDILTNPEEDKDSPDRLFNSYDFTKAYAWVVRGTSYLSDNDKLISPCLMLNLGDYKYDTESHKLIKNRYQHTKIRYIGDWDADIDSIITHEFMHLYDAYKILKNKKLESGSSISKLNKTLYDLRLDKNVKGENIDSKFISDINWMLYKFKDTERNAFNSGLYSNISKFLLQEFENNIISQDDVNILASEIKNNKIYKIVKEFCHSSSEDMINRIGNDNFNKLINWGKFNLFKKKMSINEKLNYIKRYYRHNAKELYKKELDILGEAIQNHNEEVKKLKDKNIHENYGYPSIMGNTSNSLNSTLNLMGYQYQLLPLNDYYQQEKNKPTNWQYIHQGSKVKAYTLGSDAKIVIGRIAKIEKNELGEVINVYVIKYDPEKDGNITVKVDPNRIVLNNNYTVKSKIR